MRKVSYAIIGAGDAGRRHALAIASSTDSTLTCVADIDLNAAAKLAEQFSLSPSAAMPVERTFESDADVLCICTPPSSHVALATLGLRRKYHVLVEKPLVSRASDIQALEEESQGSEKLLGAICQHRFSVGAHQIKRCMADGFAPQTAAVSVRRRRNASYFSDSWKGDLNIAGGGALLSLGFHSIDLLCWWLGKPVRAVALARRVASNNVENSLVGGVLFESGVSASIEICAGDNPTQPDLVSICGDKEVITWKGDTVQIGSATVAADKLNLHQMQIDQFSSAVRGTGGVVFGVTDVSPSLMLIDALYRSDATGVAIEIAH
jgi:predicted dehydrogenase